MTLFSLIQVIIFISFLADKGKILISLGVSDENALAVWDISQEYPRELLKVLKEFHDQLSESLNEQAAELVNSYEFKIGKERL